MRSTSYSGDEIAHELAIDTAGMKGVVVRSFAVKAGTLLRDICNICKQRVQDEYHYHLFRKLSNPK